MKHYKPGQFYCLNDVLYRANRKVFELFYKDNLNIGEISEALDIPKGTIKSTLSRTRRKLKRSIH